MDITTQEIPLGELHESPKIQRRFMDLVAMEPNTGCWIWMGKPNKHGYGRFTFDRRHVEYAHRVSWTLHRGKIPAGLWVLHRCDFPPCVNPDHLFLGTRTINVRDMCTKGRQWMQRPGRPETAIEQWNREHPERPKGEANGRSKLTDAQVIEMRELYAAGAVQESLAKRFGIAQITVCRIVIGRIWSHVGGPITHRGNGHRQTKRQREVIQ